MEFCKVLLVIFSFLVHFCIQINFSYCLTSQKRTFASTICFLAFLVCFVFFFLFRGMFFFFPWLCAFPMNHSWELNQKNKGQIPVIQGEHYWYIKARIRTCVIKTQIKTHFNHQLSQFWMRAIFKFSPNLPHVGLRSVDPSFGEIIN